MPTDTPSAMLVWRESTRSYEGLEAETPFGAFYRIENLDPPGWDAYFDAPDTLKDGAGALLAEHLPEASARAACEADYRERMRAAGWVPADAIRAEIAWHEAAARSADKAREDARAAGHDDDAILNKYAAKDHEAAAARLSAILPAQEETPDAE